MKDKNEIRYLKQSDLIEHQTWIRKFVNKLHTMGLIR